MIAKSQSDRKRSRFRRRWFVLGILVVLVVVGGIYLYRVYSSMHTVLRMLPVIEASEETHHYGDTIRDLEMAAPAANQLVHEVRWMRVLRPMPLVGGKIGAAVDLAELFNAVTRTGVSLQPVLKNSTDATRVAGSTAWLRNLNPQAVRSIVRSYHLLEYLPTHEIPASLQGPVASVQHRLAPWAGLATLMNHHPRAIETLFHSQQTERFLIIFQDSGELRSTGGFIAAYGFLLWHDGHIRMTFGPDISRLSNEVRVKLKAPWVLRQYFGQSTLSFINANVNPNVPSSARTIEALYDSIPHHAPINGVIFGDSWMADRVLRVLGPVRMDGVTFTASNLNYEMEYMAEDRGLGNSTRLMFLGDILRILGRRAESSSTALKDLLSVVIQSLRQKQLMVYANNPDFEQWLGQQGWTGAIPRLPAHNSLMVLNDNYGGLKDNYFMASDVHMKMKRLMDDRYQETVTTQWTLSGIRNGWLVSTYVGWIQCLVPPGTRLLSLSGYHVHGVRETTNHSLNRTDFGTGILIAARSSTSAPDSIRTLKWVFLLPAMKQPTVVHVLVQPGLPDQFLTYVNAKGSHRVIHQHTNVTIHLKP